MSYLGLLLSLGMSRHIAEESRQLILIVKIVHAVFLKILPSQPRR